MKIKVKVCTEKHIIEARTVVLDTEEYPRLQEMIDNGELKDISNGGEYPEGGRFWRLDWTDTTAKEFLVDAWQIATRLDRHNC
jgi:1,2-phenylacetyl-CoA epoxidase catalytic subunit